MSELNINWSDVVKKGEVQDVEQGFVATRRGLPDKHSYFFPKVLVNRFDGKTLFLKVTDKDLKKFQKDRK